MTTPTPPNATPPATPASPTPPAATPQGLPVIYPDADPWNRDWIRHLHAQRTQDDAGASAGAGAGDEDEGQDDEEQDDEDGKTAEEDTKPA